jgi:branched-chain amino acid aminotransferase
VRSVEAQAGVIDIDGVVCAAADATVSALDRGFLYGDSAFEVMRTYGGRAFREREHLERLARSCEGLRIPLPVTLEVIAQRIRHASQLSGLPEQYVRVAVTRGVGPLGIRLPAQPRPSVLVYALPLDLPDAALYRDGIEVGLVHVGRATDGTSAAGAKTSNYLTSVLALDDVRQRGCAEAIVVGPQGELIEGATSNLFIVRGQGSPVLETPPISSGILEGITRATVIELATQLGIPVREQPIASADLYGADEAFITSTVRELVPVVRADGVVVGQGKPGPVVARLLEAYRLLARAPEAA